MGALPIELFQRSLQYIDVMDLFRMCNQEPSLSAVADCPLVWSRKVLRVLSESDVYTVLKQTNLLLHIRHLDFSDSTISEATMFHLFGYMNDLESIQISKMEIPITDEIIGCLVTKYGKTLKSLKLDRSYYLTNKSIELITQSCTHLEQLSLYACMFSDSSIKTLAGSPLSRTLKYLGIGRCHIINLESICEDLCRLKQLGYLDISYNDTATKETLESMVEKLKKLKTVDITDCLEICKKDIKAVLELKHSLNLIHSAKIEDYTPASIRSYLLSFTVHQYIE